MIHSLTATTRFGLLRHAETEWNKQKRIQGHSDSPLTEDGIASADQWGVILKAFHFDRILCSDLDRVINTVRIINRHLNLPVSKEMRLREQYWGQWEGLSIPEIENTDEFIRIRLSGWDFRPPSGESRQEVWHRSRKALILAADRWPGDTLLVLAHEGVIRCVINKLCNRKLLQPEAPLIKSKHLHWLVCLDGQLKIEEINAIQS